MQPDSDHGEYSFERQARSSGLVLGRKTYEGLAAFGEPVGKWADMVNPLPSTSGPTACPVISSGTRPCSRGTFEDSIPKLTDEVDGDLYMHGSGEFAYALAEKALIDEYEVYLNPLVWARETSTCSATGEPSGWSSDVKRFDSGVGPPHLSFPAS